MKKITLSMAVWAVCIVFTFAQESTDRNLLLNGGFEDTNYVVFDYDNGSVKGCPNLIEGWDKKITDDPGTEILKDDFNNSGLSKYNVRATMGKYEENESEDASNKQYIRIQRYEWTKATDGPTDGGITQTVEIAPNTKYTLSFLYRLSAHNEGSTIVPAFYQIQEDNKAPKKKMLYNELDEKWYSKEFSYTTSATAKTLKVTLGVEGGLVYSWGGNIKLWADYDNVSLIQNGVSSIHNLTARANQLQGKCEDGYLRLSGLCAGHQVKIFNAVGTIVATFVATEENAEMSWDKKGVYFVHCDAIPKSLKFIAK